MNPPPEGVADGDFEILEAAVMETARGRWFLAEFARRQRAGDAARILETLERIEARANQADEAEARARREAERAAELMRELADALKDMRPASERPRNAPPALLASKPANAANASLEQRLAGLVHLDSLDVEAKLKLFG